MFLSSYNKALTPDSSGLASGTNKTLPYNSLTSPMTQHIFPSQDVNANNYLSGTSLEPSSGVLLVLCEKLDNQAQVRSTLISVVF